MFKGIGYWRYEKRSLVFDWGPILTDQNCQPQQLYVVTESNSFSWSKKFGFLLASDLPLAWLGNPFVHFAEPILLRVFVAFVDMASFVFRFSKPRSKSSSPRWRRVAQMEVTAPSPTLPVHLRRPSAWPQAASSLKTWPAWTRVRRIWRTTCFSTTSTLSSLASRNPSRTSSFSGKPSDLLFAHLGFFLMSFF